MLVTVVYNNSSKTIIITDFAIETAWLYVVNWIKLPKIYTNVSQSKYLNWPLPQWRFTEPMETNDETNKQINITRFQNPNWQEADQLAIYKLGWGVKL